MDKDLSVLFKYLDEDDLINIKKFKLFNKQKLLFRYLNINFFKKVYLVIIYQSSEVKIRIKNTDEQNIYKIISEFNSSSKIDLEKYQGHN